MTPRPPILVMIPYGVTIGFAIGRLVSVFYEMALAATGEESSVHFAFSNLEGGRAAGLPAGFANLVAFHPREYTPQSLEELLTYVRRHRVTTVFALDLPVAARFLGQLRSAGVRTVVSYWGAPMSSINYGLKRVAKRIEVRLFRPHQPDHYIFESRAMQDLAVRGRGLPATKTSVIPTGVDARRFRPRPEVAGTVRRRFGLPPESKIIVFMGHLHERKGVQVLLEALALIRTQHQRMDIHGLFLGNRPGEAEPFAGLIEAAGEAATIGGYHDDIPDLLAGCYAGCIPSTGWDSFPMSSLEMQACGLPVLVSDLQGVPETIDPGFTGIVTPAGVPGRLADAILGLVDDPEKREAMSAAARARIERGFTREHQVRNLTTQLGRLVGR